MKGILLRLSVALVVCAALGEAALAQEAEKTFRLTLQHSLSDVIGKNILQFKNEVEAASNGEIKVELFDKGQLYPDYQVPEAVGGGTIEMGVTPLAQFAQYIPVTGVFMQPFLFNFTAIVRAASRRNGVIRKLIDNAILKETGARVLWWQPDGWNVVFSKASAVNPNALSGKNIRVFDDVSAEFVTLCGATPQVISESKQVEALDLNLVDSTITSAASVRSYELWQKTKFLSDIRHSANILVVLINDDMWQKLSESQKTALNAAAVKAETRIWESFESDEADLYAYARERGMTIERPTSNDVVEWRICSSSILESFMSRAGSAGRELLASYGKLRADPCCNQTSEPSSSQAAGQGSKTRPLE